MAMIPQAADSMRVGLYDCGNRTDPIANPLSHPSKPSNPQLCSYLTRVMAGSMKPGPRGVKLDRISSSGS
jgi:hypothetical protein